MLPTAMWIMTCPFSASTTTVTSAPGGLSGVSRTCNDVFASRNYEIVSERLSCSKTIVSLRPNLYFNSKIVQNMYKRQLQSCLQKLSETFPVVSVTGPRQSGKTTLCKMTFAGYDYINLEDEESRMILEQDIKGYLRAHSNGLIIDEAHYFPEVFSALQVVADEDMLVAMLCREAATGSSCRTSASRWQAGWL